MLVVIALLLGQGNRFRDGFLLIFAMCPSSSPFCRNSETSRSASRTLRASRMRVKNQSGSGSREPIISAKPARFRRRARRRQTTFSRKAGEPGSRCTGRGSVCSIRSRSPAGSRSAMRSYSCETTAIETEQFDMASAIRIAWTPRMQEQALIA